MGLDASVACNCVREGRAKPHPFPELLEIDEYGEAVLRDGASEKQWIAHDHWVAQSCEHQGFLVNDRLGNIATIAHVRSVVASCGKNAPLLLTRVLYSGTHCGDVIAETAELIREIDSTLEVVKDELSVDLLTQLRKIAAVSVASGNPLVF